MRTRACQTIVAVHVAVLAALSAAHAGRIGISAAQRSGEGSGAHVLVLPTRRASEAPPAAPPALPAAAERVTPLTLEMVVRWKPVAGRAQTRQQTVSRTADRVHVAARHGREWLFERNVRDPRRVSGFLIDHAAHAIVAHEESDLRMLMGVRGWADVLMLGFDRDLLGDSMRPAQTRTIGGLRFARYAPDRKHAWTGELWWSEQSVLPSEFTIADSQGLTRFSIARIRAGVEDSLLRAPASRFPAYRVFTVANWLERH